MNARLAAGLLLILTLAASCHWPLTGGTVDSLSFVYGAHVPDTVQAGRPFEISFMSATGDPRWSSGGEEIHSGSGGVLIVPRDRYHDTGAAATWDIDVRHALRLTLSKPGSTRLFIMTRRYVPDGPDSIERLAFPLAVLP